MGRKKIENFSLIDDTNKRKTMCSKRSFGFLKKGIELMQYTGARVALLVEMPDAVRGGKQVMALSNGGNHLEMVKDISKTINEGVYFEEVSIKDYNEGRKFQTAAPHIGYVNEYTPQNSIAAPPPPTPEIRPEGMNVLVRKKNYKPPKPPASKRNPYDALKPTLAGVKRRTPTGRQNSRRTVTAQVIEEDDTTNEGDQTTNKVVKVTETSTLVREFMYREFTELKDLLPEKYKDSSPSSSPSSPSSSPSEDNSYPLESDFALTQVTESGWKNIEPPPEPWVEWAKDMPSIEGGGFNIDDFMQFDHNERQIEGALWHPSPTDTEDEDEVEGSVWTPTSGDI